MAAGEKFASEETASRLLNIYHGQISEGFTIVASVGLSHLSKLNPVIFPQIFESITAHKFLSTFFEGHPRTQ